MARGNPLISRLSTEAQKNPYANQPLDYYDGAGRATTTQAPSPYAAPNPAAAQPGPQTADAEQLNRMYQAPSATPADTRRATLNDVVAKTLSLLGLVIVGAAVGWFVPGLGFLGGIVGLVVGLVVVFKRNVSPVLTMVYAVAEGLLLGAISGVFEAQYGGIVVNAVLATVVVFIGMLMLYAKAGVRLSQRMVAILGIGMIAYLVFLVGNFVFGMITGSSMRDVEIFGIPLGIPLGLIVVAMAAISLIADFQNIDEALRAGVPEKESWRLAFGLIVTLVWLYIEILRLFSYFMRSDD